MFSFPFPVTQESVDHHQGSIDRSICRPHLRRGKSTLVQAGRQIFSRLLNKYVVYRSGIGDWIRFLRSIGNLSSQLIADCVAGNVATVEELRGIHGAKEANFQHFSLRRLRLHAVKFAYRLRGSARHFLYQTNFHCSLSYLYNIR